MKKPSILICDDEPGVRESLKYILGDEYALAYAANGVEAVDYIKANDVDMAILDIKMPKLNGLEALQQIKQAKPNLPVLMLTGYEAIDVASQAMNLGANNYLTKPIHEEKVLAQVRALLNPAEA